MMRFVPIGIWGGETGSICVGCGSLNAFMVPLALLILGAERAYALDLDPVQNMSVAEVVRRS